MGKAAQNTVDEAEIAKFTAMAEQWWDESGKFKPLHKFNPVRLKFLRDTITEHFRRKEENSNAKDNTEPETRNLKPLEGLSLLDVGCGGGLLSEPLTRMGAKVTGIDAGEANIKIASIHAKNEGLDIDYQCVTAEEMLLGVSCQVSEGKNKSTPKPTYDIVIAMEIIEHVADVPSFIESCCKLVKPGGLLFFATMNRTVKSYALAIVGAEYILRWLPRGTHDWKKFLKPSEIVLEAETHKMKATNVQGVTFNPLNQQWSLSNDTDVNYMVVLEK